MRASGSRSRCQAGLSPSSTAGQCARTRRAGAAGRGVRRDADRSGMGSRARCAEGRRRGSGDGSVGWFTTLVDTSVLVGTLAPSLSEPWVVSVVSVGELEAGVLLASDSTARAQRLRRLTALLQKRRSSRLAGGRGSLRRAARRYRQAAHQRSVDRGDRTGSRLPAGHRRRASRFAAADPLHVGRRLIAERR